MSRFATLGAVIFASIFPTLVTWAYFVALQDRAPAVQQTAYSLGKFIQFAFPAVWVLMLCRRWPVAASSQNQRPPESAPDYLSSIAVGVLFGGVVVATMAAIYFWGLSTAASFAGAREAIQQRVAGLAIDRWWKYAVLAGFYALIHSLLEEYYFRWFVAGQLQRIATQGNAIVWSSLAFMAHHIIVLASYFGWTSPWTAFLSLSVGVGGACWTWLYFRYRTLAGPWISHLLVDAGIFLIGAQIVDFGIVPN